MKLDRAKLIRAREMLGYGVEKTAEVAGVSKNSVLRAEHEEDIRPVTARKIATALQVRVADLLGKVEASEQPETFVDMLLRTPPIRPEDMSDAQRAQLKEVVRGERPRATIEDTDETVTLKINYVQLLEENHRLLQEVRRLRGQLEESATVQPSDGKEHKEYVEILKEKGFSSEQIASWLAQNERDEEFIRRELEKMSPKDFLEALIASPGMRRIRDYYRDNDPTASIPQRSESA